jgi:hypothetical protein
MDTSVMKEGDAIYRREIHDSIRTCLFSSKVNPNLIFF